MPTPQAGLGLDGFLSYRACVPSWLRFDGLGCRALESLGPHDIDR